MSEMKRNNNYREKVLEVVNAAKQPIDPENVRVRAGIANWQTALKHLLELRIEGQIEGEKTTKSWVFSRKKGTPASE